MVLLDIASNLQQFWHFTGFYNCEWTNLIMICVGLFFIYLAIKHDFEPMLLVPIGFGILIGNIPFQPGNEIGIYEEGSVLNILYQGVRQGWYPPLIFLGIGAMTDFSALLANPKLMLVGAAAQFGIFGAYMIATGLRLRVKEAFRQEVTALAQGEEDGASMEERALGILNNESYRQILVDSPDSMATIYRALGNAYYKERNFTEAAENYRVSFYDTVFCHYRYFYSDPSVPGGLL